MLLGRRRQLATERLQWVGALLLSQVLLLLGKVIYAVEADILL